MNNTIETSKEPTRIRVGDHVITIDTDDVRYLKSQPFFCRKDSQGKLRVFNSRGEQLHRLLLKVTDKNTWVVPINGDNLDFRRENLKVLTKDDKKQKLLQQISKGHESRRKNSKNKPKEISLPKSNTTPGFNIGAAMQGYIERRAKEFGGTEEYFLHLAARDMVDTKSKK